MVYQSLVFKKKNWTLAEAIDYLKNHDYKGLQVDEKPLTWRFRQADPDYKKYKYRTEKIEKGLQGIKQKEKKKKYEISKIEDPNFRYQIKDGDTGNKKKFGLQSYQYYVDHKDPYRKMQFGAKYDTANQDISVLLKNPAFLQNYLLDGDKDKLEENIEQFNKNKYHKLMLV